MTLRWTTWDGPVPAGPVPDHLVALAQRCRRADGGLPLADDPDFLARRWAAPGGVRFGLRAPDGSLLAAGTTCPLTDGVIVTGLVDPAARGRGLGAEVLDRCLALAAGEPVSITAAPPAERAATTPGPAAGAGEPAERRTSAAGSAVGAAECPTIAARSVEREAIVAGSAGSASGEPTTGVAERAATVAEAAMAAGEAVTITVETESLTDAAAALFASRGLRQVFAEDVMRITPGAAPEPRWPDGVELTEWSAGTARRFHDVFESAFRDRPAFPGTPADEWIADNAEDEEFRPGWSILAAVPGIGDAGFVTAAVGWVVQVGVRPQARGRGIGAALICESLRRMALDGATEAWLDVNVNNPGAAALYRRLGFTDAGRRARFRR